VRLDIICRHDLVDVEVDGRHTLINRFWNPQGDRFGVWAEDGPLTVRGVVVRPLREYVPHGALRSPEPRPAQQNGISIPQPICSNQPIDLPATDVFRDLTRRGFRNLGRRLAISANPVPLPEGLSD
jgi:hypothetical protein